MSSPPTVRICKGLLQRALWHPALRSGEKKTITWLGGIQNRERGSHLWWLVVKLHCNDTVCLRWYTALGSHFSSNEDILFLGYPRLASSLSLPLSTSTWKSWCRSTGQVRKTKIAENSYYLENQELTIFCLEGRFLKWMENIFIFCIVKLHYILYVILF